jgi:hypothetical protein
VLAACDFLPFEFGDDGAVIQRHANIRLHPSLEDTQLGWALIDSAAQIADGPSQLMTIIDAHCS